MLIIQNGQLKVDLDRRQVLLGEREVALGPLELDFLAALMTVPRCGAVSRKELLESIWQMKEVDIIETRTIDAMVYRLGKKLGKEWFRTISGYGYAFSSPTGEETKIVTEAELEKVV